MIPQNPTDGKACKTCNTFKHTSEFTWQKSYPLYVHERCRDCIKESRKEYARKRRERLIQEGKIAPAKVKKEHVAKVHREKKTPEEYKKNAREWWAKNPEKRREAKYRRRAHGKNAGKFDMQAWNDLCESYGQVCLCCKQKKPVTIDHIVPLSCGGTNHISNLQPLCVSCNSRKGIKTTNYR